MILGSPDNNFNEKLDKIIAENTDDNVKITAEGDVQKFKSQDIIDFKFDDINEKHYLIRNAGNYINKGDICFLEGVEAKAGWGSGTTTNTLTNISTNRTTKYIRSENIEVIDNGTIDIDSDVITAINIFSTSDNGDAINSIVSGYNAYVGNDQIVYGGGGQIRKKSVNNNENGELITSSNATDMAYIGNNEMIYVDANNLLIYKKSTNDSNNGTAITTDRAINLAYIGNNQIVYVNIDDGSKLYKKSVNDTSNGTAINSVASGFPCYIGNNEIAYKQNVTTYMYKKSLNDTNNGTAITTDSPGYITYIGNNEIIYENVTNGNILYKKSVNDTSNGTAMNTHYSAFVSYIGKNEIIYSDYDALYFLRKKQISNSIQKTIQVDNYLYYQKQTSYNSFSLYRYNLTTDTETLVLTITGTLFARCINIHDIEGQLYLVYSKDTDFEISKVIGSNLETVYNDEYSIESSYQKANYIFFISGSRQVVRYDALNNDLVYSSQKIDRNKIQFSNDGIYVFDIYGDKYDKFDYELNYDTEYTLSANWRLRGEGQDLIVLDDDGTTIKVAEIKSDTVDEIGSFSYSNTLKNTILSSYEKEQNKYIVGVSKTGDLSRWEYQEYPNTTALIGVALNDANINDDVAIQTEDLDTVHSSLITGQEYFVDQDGKLTTTDTGVRYGKALAIDRIQTEYTAKEIDDFLDGKFDKSGGTITNDTTINGILKSDRLVDNNQVMYLDVTGNGSLEHQIVMFKLSGLTTNFNSLIIYDSNGTSLQHRIRSSNGVTSLCVNGGTFTVGTTGIHSEKAYIEGSIKANGDVLPAIDDTHNIGSSSFRYNDIWATNNVIQTSDINKKENIKTLDLGIEFIKALNPVSYTWKNRVIPAKKTVRTEEKIKTEKRTCKEYQIIKENGKYVKKLVDVVRDIDLYKEFPLYDEKGNIIGKHREYIYEEVEIVDEEPEKVLEYRRQHFGLIAQQVKATLDKLGINTNDFAGYVEDDNGCGLRYIQFIPILIKAVQELKKEIDGLKGGASE